MKLNFKHLSIAILASLVIIFSFSTAAYIQYQMKTEVLKRQAIVDLSQFSSTLEKLFSERLYKTSGLGAYYGKQPNESFDQYTNFCETVFGIKDPYIRSLTILKDTTAVFVWPKKGNEKVLNVDLSTIKGQRDTILFVKNNLQPVTTNPIKLIQGGKGIITRMPIVIHDPQKNPEYVGQVSIVLDYDELINASKLKELGKTYHLVVEDVSKRADVKTTSPPAIIYESQAKLISDPVSISIDLPNSTWQLSVSPISGWHVQDDFVLLYALMGTVCGILAFIFVYFILQTRSELDETVRQRTSELIQTNEYLEESMAELEEKQAELTLVNDMLENSVLELKETQEQLIQSEKFAALGELVAGVAHEINTPLGIGITLGTFIENKHVILKKHFEENTLTRLEMTEYFDSVSESLAVMVNSLNRSAEIVASFKTVAVEQSSLDLRRFNVSQYMNDVLINLKPKFKMTKHQLDVQCPPDLEIVSYPGAFSHILTNFIVNSLIHGFEHVESGHISIQLYKKDDKIHFIYSDDGNGIAPEIKDRVFNPFFTTKKGAGSTGLGLHIIHNIVTQVLGGTIQLESSPGHGCTFKLIFPEGLFPHETT